MNRNGSVSARDLCARVDGDGAQVLRAAIRLRIMVWLRAVIRLRIMIWLRAVIRLRIMVWLRVAIRLRIISGS